MILITDFDPIDMDISMVDSDESFHSANGDDSDDETSRAAVKLDVFCTDEDHSQPANTLISGPSESDGDIHMSKAETTDADQFLAVSAEDAPNVELGGVDKEPGIPTTGSSIFYDSSSSEESDVDEDTVSQPMTVASSPDIDMLPMVPTESSQEAKDPSIPMLKVVVEMMKETNFKFNSTNHFTYNGNATLISPLHPEYAIDRTDWQEWFE